ncbi:bifunctional metallophosphatase/5'-nucleotidase [Streptomyces sp. SID13666]|uniref:metallophosphoesterase n=1 Tax=unclassified Streptomyces TaxID=2593676 RepID=UPI0013C089E7|nr:MULTISPECIES: metallophosphoesterase [unclassified Streptomyces]NEA60179.1 bifunctional metallophosphatase/5'-nucleotidase [Streptomyces sp. SID13666]NEA74222.1 bifunctional metallophosphatase/5'-nucleotidase [Streptomyces sp. SID13588]
MTGTRPLARIVATTDVHSALDNARPLLAHLHAARADCLVVDCGDFFEGTGYYRLGAGATERQILLSLYDVIAPGNHGWPHHREPELQALTVCANVVHDRTGDLLFRPLHRARIGGRTMAVTAVLGVQAFDAIPAHQRIADRVIDPVRALAGLFLAHRHEVDAWVLLSHSGFAEDLELARHCPFLDVVFAGHCHSEHYAPQAIGDTLVVKGRELGLGYATAEPVGAGWAAHTHLFAPSTSIPPGMSGPVREIDRLRRRLAAPLGPLTRRWRGTRVDRQALAAATAARLHAGLGADAVILNETALRTTSVGEVLTLGDLLALEPFANELVHALVPRAMTGDVPGLLAHLTAHAGPLATAPDPLPGRVHTVLTTRYLADSYLDGHGRSAAVRLGHAVRHVLTTEPLELDQGAPR